MTMRGWIAQSALATTLLTAGALGAQPPAASPPAARPGAAHKPIAPTQARYAPGQVALYRVLTTTPGTPQTPATATHTQLRVEVLRRTDQGVIVRCSELRAPTPDAANGPSVTVDVLIRNGASPVAADDQAAFATLAGGVGASPLRKDIAADRVKDALYALAGALFDGTGGLIHEHTSDNTTSVNDGGIKVVLSRQTSAVAHADGGLLKLTTVTTIPIQAQRRELRAELSSQHPDLDAAALDKLIAVRNAPTEEARTESAVLFDSATGWPRSAAYTRRDGDGAQTSRHFTLTDGPSPAVPPPPLSTTGVEYARWVVSLVESAEPPLCEFGKHAADTMQDPTPAQRQVFIDAAIADNPPTQGAIPPTLVFADVAARGMTADQAGRLELAFAALTPSARLVVLQRIVYIKEQWGRDLFARLLATTPKETDLADLPAFDASREPDVAAAALEAYLNAFKPGTFDWGTLYTTYQLRESHKLEGELKTKSVARAADALAALLAQMEPAQQPQPGAWVYADDYARRSATAALAADVLGSAGGDTGLAELNRTLKLTDPRPRAFAAVALAQRGHAPDASTFKAICASDTGWDAVVRGLATAGKTDLIPVEARSLDLAARADLVRWLVYPTELGRTPDAIEQVSTFDTEARTGPRRYYIFKFRSDLDAFKKEGWMLGISGPWDPGADYTQKPGGHTFSKFDPIDTEKAEQQAREIVQLLEERWRMRQGAGSR